LDALLRECAETHPDARVRGVGITGSGRGLIERLLPCVPVNEITAHAAAIAALHPEVRTIVEIGGQDSKLIILDDAPREGKRRSRAITHFAMNELCAAGTGAFLDQQSARLGISIEAFSNLALTAAEAVPIAGRCAVFAKTDMTHHQQEGRSLADIVAGLYEALARSYMANLVRGRELPRPIAFQGGVAAGAALVRTFERLLCPGEALIVPAHHKVMGAIGAALASGGEAKGEAWALCDLAATLGREAERSPGAPAASNASGRLHRPRGQRFEPDFSGLCMDGACLGIDVGSVSVKLAVLSRGRLLDADYHFTDGRPVDALRAMLARLSKRVDPATIRGVGVTGSGRHFVGALIGADAVRNEISAQALAASVICPGADTVFEIGGQDAKFMRVRERRAEGFSMNRVCAAGTGAFLQEQAARLEVRLDGEFAEAAFESEHPAELGARCTVFMESDLVSHQQTGASRSDLIAGLSRSVVANYMEKVVAGARAGSRAVFLGGVAENEAIVAALEEQIGIPVLTSTVGRLSGAIGAAIAASDEVQRTGKPSAFRAEDAKLAFDTHTCDGCAMNCRVSSTRGTPQRHFGGRCGKWEGAGRTRAGRRDTPVARRREAVLGAARAGAGGAGPAVGIPLALMAYDLMPAWRTFFEELGCRVVVSPPTNDAMLAEGMKRLVVETCLPVKAFCCHVHWLSEQSVDFIFAPSLVITGRDAHGKETAHCPYIQSLPQFARPLTQKPLLNPLINWKLDPGSEAREMATLATKLGRST
ncbi:MAG: acyl-CoA dehydratase activase, partial [Planctomycetota bacterium]